MWGCSAAPSSVEQTPHSPPSLPQSPAEGSPAPPPRCCLALALCHVFTRDFPGRKLKLCTVQPSPRPKFRPCLQTSQFNVSLIFSIS